MPSAGAGTSPWLHDCSWQAGAHSNHRWKWIFIHISSFHLTNSLSTPSHYIYIFKEIKHIYILFVSFNLFYLAIQKWACCHWSFTKTFLKLILTRLGFLKAGAVSGHRHFSVFPTPLLLLQEDRWPFWAPYQTQARASPKLQQFGSHIKDSVLAPAPNEYESDQSFQATLHSVSIL